MYGGIAQGIGLALTEDFLDESKYNNFVTMGLPYIKDVPDDIKLIHVETPRPLGLPELPEQVKRLLLHRTFCLQRDQERLRSEDQGNTGNA